MWKCFCLTKQEKKDIVNASVEAGDLGDGTFPVERGNVEGEQ